MNPGDVIIYEEDETKVTFIYDRLLPGHFIKAVGYSTSDYLLGNVLCVDAFFHAGCCRLANQTEIEQYNNLKRKDTT